MNTVAKFFERVFDIRAGEWQRLLLLYGLAFMLNVTVIWGKASSESLFLKQVGIEILPLMFVADAILNIITLVIYTAFADRISNRNLMIYIPVLGAISLVGAVFGLGAKIHATYFFLFLANRVMQVVISIHAWTYIADYYDTRTAKRHFPLIASGSRTSGILAGLLIVPIVTLTGTSGLIIAWAISLVGCSYIAWYTPRRTPPVIAANESREHQHFTENMKSGFEFVSKSGFLKLMSAAAFVGTILIYLLDFQSQVYFDNHFTSAEDLAAFFGILVTISNLITLPIQMVILSRLVNKLGVGNANLIFPSITSISYALLLIPTLMTASLAYITHTALRSAFRTPIDSLLYNAVPSNVKARARAFNGLLIPVGSLFAGIALIALPGDSNILKGFGVVVAIAYVYVAYRLRREYSRSLTSLLAEDDMNIFRMGDSYEDQPKDVTIRLLKQRVDVTEDPAIIIFLGEMLVDAQGRAAIPYLKELADKRGDAVKTGIIDLIGEFWVSDPQVRQMCIAGLFSPSPDVRRAALDALVNKGNSKELDEELLETFLEFLSDPDEDIQSMVVPALIASGDFYYLAPAVDTLSKWLSPTAPNNERTHGLRVLAKTGSERMVHTMIRYLDDSEPMVRRQAADLIDNLAAHSPDKEIRELGVTTLSGLLSDADEAVRLTAVNGLSSFESESASKALVNALGDRSFMVRRQASQLISKRVEQELETALDLENQYLAESAAFILSSSNHTRARRRAMELMEKLIGDSYALIAQRLPLKGIDTPGVALLRMTLQEQENQLMERFFWLLGALSSEDEARTIRLALSTTDPLRSANAMEALESLTSPSIARQVMPLYTGADLTNQVQEWRTSLNLAMVTRWQAFFQFFPRLRAASRNTTSVITREMYLPDDDGWLTATSIFAIVEMLEQKLIDESAPIDQEVIQLAIEASTRDDKPLVRETAESALKRLQAFKIGKAVEGTHMLSTIEKVIFLKEVPFFAEMPVAQLRVLASISEEKTYKEGENIYKEGEFGDALFVIINGEVALQKSQTRGRQTSIKRLTTLANREYFAEMSIFDDKPHQHDAVAVKETQLLVIRRETLVALINYQPELGLTLLKVLSERLREFTDVIAEKSEAKPEQLVNLFDRLS